MQNLSALWRQECMNTIEFHLESCKLCQPWGGMNKYALPTNLVGLTAFWYRRELVAVVAHFTLVAPAVACLEVSFEAICTVCSPLSQQMALSRWVNLIDGSVKRTPD